MKVLDATFLIDYLGGVNATAEVLVGEGNAPDGDVSAAKADLSWGAVYEPDESTAAIAGELADEIGPDGPFLAGMDGLIAATGRELGAPIVTNDSDLTHEVTKRVVEVEEYRQ